MRRNARQNRQQAQDTGQPHYFGRACRYCSSTKRDTATARCGSCDGDRRGTIDDQLRAKARDYYHKTRLTHHNRRLFSDAKSRAKAQGIVFDIKLEDIVIPTVCPVLKKPMVSPSIDRKDNTKGYVKGNVFVISLEANQKKRNSSVEDLEMILDYMKS